MSQSAAISLWDKSAAESPYESEMQGDRACDLAIVGGGFTGLSTALHAAEKGLDCHLLEARQIGYGGSGRNAGQVTPESPLPLKQLQARLGEAKGAALSRRMADMPDYVFELIEKHQIRCEPHRSGLVTAASSSAAFAEMKSRFEHWDRIGAPVEFLSKEQAAEVIGGGQYRAALLDRRGGTINPMGFARGLARAAAGAGATISTGATAQKLRRDGGLWKVETDRGVLTAKHVVIGANAYADDLWPGLKQTFSTVDYFQVATVPLGADADAILPGRQALIVIGLLLFAVRRDDFNRLIIGSVGPAMGGLSGVSSRWAQRTIARLFPKLGKVAMEEVWCGRLALTPDHIYRVHRPAPGLYTPTAYNGLGITAGVMFGRAMAELLTGADEDTLPVPVTNMKPVFARGLRRSAMQAALAANQIVRSL